MRDLERPQTGAHTSFCGSILSFAAGATGIALLVFVYCAFTWRSFSGVSRAINAFMELFSDFIIYYFPMGEAIFRTGLPIDGFLYSPIIAILLAVFPPLGLTASLVLWGVLQVLFVILFLLLFRWLVPAVLQVQLLFVTLALSSYPLILNLLGGQVSVFMIVGILGLLVLKERSYNAAGAGLLAFAASFKFYPVLFIVPFAARFDKRFLLYAALAIGAFLFVVPGVLIGFGDTLRFYGVLLHSFRESAWVTANPHSQYFPHLVLRLADTMAYNAEAYLPLLILISFGIAAANLGLVFLVQRSRRRDADLWSFQIVFLTLPFILKTSWPHDFVFLPFTQALMVWWLLGGMASAPGTDMAEKRTYVSRRLRLHSIVTISLLLPSIFLSNIVFFNLFGDFTLYGFYGFLFWANLLLLIAVYIQLLPPALRQIKQIRRSGSENPSGHS